MDIYHYNAETGEYVGSGLARRDELQTAADGVDRYLLPANATTIAPPVPGAREVAVFDVLAGAWALAPDYRGVPCWATDTGKPVTVWDIGPLPDGVTDIEPAGEFPVWDGAGWVADLQALHADKVAELKAGCEAACRSGWISAALGEPHIYDTDKDRDQVTLTALAVAALQQLMLGNAEWTYDVTCTEVASGSKTMRLHTAAQLAQVGTEVQAMIKDNKARYYALLAELDAAYAAGDDGGMLDVGWE